MIEAELHGAFRWDCDECGTENFVRAIEGGIDEAALNAAENRVEGHLEAIAPAGPEGEDGPSSVDLVIQRLLLAPATVTCRQCNKSYPTRLPSEADADELDDE